jgi:hypothetical protein
MDTTEHDPQATPPDALRARIRSLVATDRPLTADEATEWHALTAAYRDLRRTERQAARS